MRAAIAAILWSKVNEKGEQLDPYEIGDHADNCQGVFDERGELYDDETFNELEPACTACEHERATIFKVIEDTSTEDERGSIDYYFEALEAFDAFDYFETFRLRPTEIAPDMYEVINLVRSERRKFENYQSYKANQPKAGSTG